MKIRIVYFDDLTEEQQEAASNDGDGKEFASYLKIENDGEVISLESDAMESKDVTFSRGLSWVGEMILEAYRLGMNAGRRPSDN